jgi:hypothetical protein
MKTCGNVILMAVICIVIFWIFMALRPANAQCSYAMNDVGRFHGYVSGPCNGAAVGYNGAYPYHLNARAGAHPTVVAPKVISQTNGHNVGACDSTCQSKCQGAWRALGFRSVNACVARWAKLNAEGTAATCETAIKANGMRPIRGC